MTEAHANGCDTTEQAIAVLADKDMSELRGMADRLTKSHESLTEMLKDLEVEREELEREKVQLNDTITLFMKELQKLNIGAHNTVDPILEEGPLDFVGRFWETVKPRDTAFVTGEHIGEIKKPQEKSQKAAAMPSMPNPIAAIKEAALAHELPNSERVQERVQEVQDMGKQAVKKLSNAFEEARSSGFWQRASGYLEEKRSEIAKKVQEVQASAGSVPQRHGAGRPHKKGEPRVVAADKSTDAPSASTSSPLAPQAEASPVPAEASATESAAEPNEEPLESPEKLPEKTAPHAEKAQDTAPEKEKAASPSSRQETILIEAQVKIGDGSVQTLCVKASDRCKDAAERFITENSLKASFQKPLTDFLKKVEKDADTFPVHTEIDLSDLGPPGR
ncbi:unnamed protein product [Effrenium voratum]|nr:unnamed protein product [Effrenium voratum]